MASTPTPALRRLIASVEPIVTMERGSGTVSTVEVETDRITGSALVRQDQVIHAEVHRVA